MEWYVLRYDINADKIYNYNIFTHIRFKESVEKLLASNPTDIEKFTKQLKCELMYYFWSKFEYEISVGKAFEKDMNKLILIDVYKQVEPNLKQLANYILANK